MKTNDPMAKQIDKHVRKQRRRKIGGRLIGALWYLTFGVIVMIAVVGIALQDQMVALPDSVKQRVEAQINAQAAPTKLKIDTISVGLSDGFHTHIGLTGLKVLSDKNEPIGAFEQIKIEVPPTALISGKLAPSRVAVSGVTGKVRRDKDGQLNFSIGQSDDLPEAYDLKQVLDTVNAIPDMPMLANAEALSIDGVSLTFHDEPSASWYRFEDGKIAADFTDGFEVSGTVDYVDETTGSTPFSVGYRLEDGGVSVANASVSDFSVAQAAELFAPDVAKNVQAGKTSAQVRARLEGGEISDIDVTWSLNTTQILASSGQPILIESAKAYATYNAESQRIELNQLSASVPGGSIDAVGHVLLFKTQPTVVQLHDLTLNLEQEPWGLDAPVSVTGTADLKIDMAHKSATLGQAHVAIQDSFVKAQGQVSWRGDGPVAKVAISSDHVPVSTVFHIWPQQFKVRLRDWFFANVADGALTNLTYRTGFEGGKTVKQAASFGFENADVRFLKTMPRMTQAVGFGVLHDQSFTLALDKGQVQADQGGRVRMAASSMKIANVRRKPAFAEIDLRGSGSVTSALSLLDRKPFQLMTKAKRPVTLADGQMTFAATVKTELRKSLKPKDVAYAVTGQLRDVRSAKLVPNRKLQASRLALSADKDGVKISGKAKLSGVSVDGSWRKATGDPNSQVLAKIPLSLAAMDAFGITLPKGMVSGNGTGNLVVGLRDGQAPKFDIKSDLRGVRLKIDQIAWSKPAKTKANFRIAGTLGDTPTVPTLNLDAPGITAKGNLKFKSGNSLQTARFSTLKVGNWLNSDVTLSLRGKGQSPNINLKGGTLDLRKLPQSTGDSGSSSGKITATLDRLRITPDLSLSNFEVTMHGNAKGQGRFTGRVNGGTQIFGTLKSNGSGQNIHITGPNAGAALRDAGFLDNANEGTLDLKLRTQAGGFRGRAKIKNIRVKKAPAIANLISAVSVVGAIEQMDGKGLMFADVRSEFQLKDGLITVKSASAMGPSLGISVDGFINTSRGTLDLQGVLSPFYLVNGIGAIFTRRGEGLIGFNFKLNGKSKNPRVKVNPLSAFTPGMFREIFRRPPPKLSQ